MKKLTASIVASALMISTMGINAFAAETATATPQITVYGSSVAKATGDEVNLNVRLTNFNSVAGMDITIEGTGVTFGTAPTSKEIALEADSNYKIDGNKLHIVELNGEKTETINIKVPVKATAETNSVKLTAKLAKDGKTLLTSAEYSINDKNGTVAVTPTDKSTTATELADGNGKFYPFGSVYFGTYSDDTRIEKDKDGKFNLSGRTDVKYKEFAVPTNGILTFGAGKKTDAKPEEANLQFGTYTNKSGMKYGTMLIVGNWQGYIDYKIKTEGLTAEEAIKEMYKLDKADGKDYAKASYKNEAGANKVVLVYKTSQTKYMWKAANGNSFEYALRVYNSGAYACTAVGYYTDADGSNPVFSNQLKSSSINK